MASESLIVRNIDENFCQCSICLDQFKEPKVLPCLHRFCRKCLELLIQDAQGKGLLKCPECREECDIPANGVGGFRTDFQMNNIVKFIQQQKALKDDHHPQTWRMTEDRRSYVEAESKNISGEGLVAFKDRARCRIHLENFAQLCCNTCENLPICVTCTFVEHRGHKIVDVTSLAKTERDGLIKKLDCLQRCKGTLDERITKVESLKEQIFSKGNEVMGKLESKYEDKVKEIESKRSQIRREIKTEKSAIETNSEQKQSLLRENMEREMQTIKDQYERLLEEERRKTETKLEELRNRLESEKSMLNSKHDHLKRIKSYVIQLLQAEKEKKLIENKEIAQHLANISKRYENLTFAASSVISAQNDWTAVNCIPDINSAIDPVLEQVKEDIPGLNEITTYVMSEASVKFLDVDDVVKISDQPESIIKIDYYGYKTFEIHNITYSESGNIVVSGLKKPYAYEIDRHGAVETHMTVLGMNGVIIKQTVKCYQSAPTFYFRYCAFLSRFQVATVLTHDEIGMFDIRTGSHVVRNVNDIIPNMEENKELIGICTDKYNKRIYVGCVTMDSQLIHALDNELNRCFSLKLPKGALIPNGITHCKGNLLVCDLLKKTVYRLDMDGSILCKIRYPFEVQLGPISVCTDKNGFIYTLWIKADFLGKGKRSAATEEGSPRDNTEHQEAMLVQYSQDGNHVLTKKRVDPNVTCMAIIERDQIEQLLLATYQSQKIYIFDLKRNTAMGQF